MELDFDIQLHSREFPCDDLQVFRVAGREAISQLFFFDVDVVCRQGAEMPEGVGPGAIVSLQLLRQGEVDRVFHAMIETVERRYECDGDRESYRLRLGPRARRLSLVSTQSIAMNSTVPQIIARKLELVGLGAESVHMRLLGDYPTEEFVVQYGESDLDFISRRAEHLGISFFFDHDDEDRIVFVDHAAAFLRLPRAEPLPFSRNVGAFDSVSELARVDTLTPSTFVMHDYNYRTPETVLIGRAQIEGEGGGVVEYGAHFKSPEAGAALAQIRADEARGRQRSYRGKSTVTRLAAGFRVVVEGRGNLAERELLLTAVDHRAEIPLSGDHGASSYENRFEACDTEHTYRPPRVTKKPLVPSIVTAVVQVGAAGQSGTTAELDAEGRYTVVFHFDPALGDPALKASRPVRMMQPFGGTGHGMHFPLRPGTEVIIGFTNGDPDRPMLLGAVPNAITRSPVTNVEPTRSRIVTKRGVLFEINERD
jgi:type VI secretion system secreted protein VgrG